MDSIDKGQITKGQTVTVWEKSSANRRGRVTRVLKQHFEVEIPSLGDGYVIRVLFETSATRTGCQGVILGGTPPEDSPQNIGGKSEIATGEGRWSLAELVNGP